MMWRMMGRFARALFPSWIYKGVKIAMGRELPNNIEVKCLIEMHGTKYGGWCVASANITTSSVVYSFGIGEDLSFDLSLISRFGVQVHAFDPTPAALAWAKSQNLPDLLIIHPYGLASYDGLAKLYPPLGSGRISYTLRPDRQRAAQTQPLEVPVKRLTTIMRELGHDHIDILKMDIEGMEYEVIDDIILDDLPISQLLVEFHHFRPGIRLSKTRRALERLRDKNYRISYVDPYKQEFSLIRNYHRPHEPRIRL